MSKVIFFIVKNYSKTEWLANKMFQITEASVNNLNINNLNPIVVVNSFSDIKEHKGNADLFVIFSIGNVIIDRDHFWHKIYSIDNDVGVIGNIIMHDNDTVPQLDPQCIIVRSDLLKHLNYNSFEKEGHCIKKSENDLHGGYAPEEVFLKEETQFNKFNFGSCLIENALKKGYRVRNFDEDWRYGHSSNLDLLKDYPNRVFLYPHKNSNKFEKAYKTLRVDCDLDDSQIKFITVLKSLKNLRILNVWQYEESPIFNKKISTVISPAAGFLGELSAVYNKSKTLVLYDKNWYNIDFKKHLYNNWNGKDYNKFAREYCEKHNLDIEPLSDTDRKNSQQYKKPVEERIFSDWLNFKKNTNVIFLHLDLIKELDLLEKYFLNDAVLLTSTILHEYTFTSFFYDRYDINKVKSKIQEISRQCDLTWYHPQG